MIALSRHEDARSRSEIVPGRRPRKCRKILLFAAIVAAAADDAAPFVRGGCAGGLLDARGAGRVAGAATAPSPATASAAPTLPFKLALPRGAAAVVRRDGGAGAVRDGARVRGGGRVRSGAAPRAHPRDDARRPRRRNLINTLYDFERGFDNAGSSDTTLVSGGGSRPGRRARAPRVAVAAAAAAPLLAGAVGLPVATRGVLALASRAPLGHLLGALGLGGLSAFVYTGGPGLKYRALGDVLGALASARCSSASRTSCRPASRRAPRRRRLARARARRSRRSSTRTTRATSTRTAPRRATLAGMLVGPAVGSPVLYRSG